MPPARRYATLITTLTAATAAFAVLFPLIGNAFLGVYALPSYDFELVHLFVGFVLGLAAVVVTLLFIVVRRFAHWVLAFVPDQPVLLATAGAVAMGLVGVILPLTLFSGSEQLTTVISGELGVGLLVAVLLGKIFAISVAMATGFLGGNVFPMLFIGGTSGVLAHELFSDIPIALAVSAMMAAVPGAFLRTPLTLMVFAFVAVGLSPEQVAPVVIAVVTAFVTVTVVRERLPMGRSAETASEAPASG